MTMERNLGIQPMAELMTRYGLKPHDVVAASTQQLTHKMVSRAIRGRRLTPNSMRKVAAALSDATGLKFRLEQLFNY